MLDPRDGNEEPGKLQGGQHTGEEKKKKTNHARKVRGKEHHFPHGAEHWEGRTSG